jgi:hypothetical protein
MRKPSQTLPKRVNKVIRTVKHKDSAKHLARKELKLAKQEGMDIVTSDEVRPPMTEEEKEEAKAARKKINAPRVWHKKLKKRR